MPIKMSLAKCTFFRLRPKLLYNFSRQEVIRRYCSSNVTEKKTRIGCASGFWGDTATSAPQLIHNGNIDFLVFDYLSEITMSLLTVAKHKSPEFGYAPDFIQAVMAPLLGDIKKKGVRVISNAGGINPHSCAAALQEVAKRSGVDLKVAVVTGDNIMPKKSEIFETGVSDIDSGIAMPKSLVSMNAYLGATPIARALDLGAEVVITGRCVDSAVVLGPLMHTFGWTSEDYDLLAQGSLAGHLVECGAQVTGGIFTDWHAVPDWDNIGFPIAECSSDGSFTITKPPKTGGLVSVASVAEQLVYEIGDPKHYLLPDVTCDFSQVKLTQVVDGESVAVSGALGTVPSNQYKVSATYTDGYRVTAVCPTAGINASEKARRTAESILKRVRTIFKFMGIEDFTQTNIQMLGSEDSYGPHSNSPNPREIVLWLAAQHQQKKALEILSREMAPAGTGMCPGLTGIVGGRPRVSPVLKLFSFLYPKENVTVDVEVDDHKETIEIKQQATAPSDNASPQEPHTTVKCDTGTCSYTLGQLAYARSGDKGNSANIGVIARHPSFVPYLREALTEDAIRDYFQHILEPGIDNQVQRFELPGIQAFNFLLKGALGGGGVASLRSDPQGKALAQMLLDFKIDGLPDLLSKLN